MSIDRREPPYDARQIANLFLDIAESKRVTLTNMAVNKLVFFSHAHYLAVRACALVHNPFEAWDHGPVAPAVYAEFRRFGASPITSRATVLDISSDIRRVAPTNLTESDRRFVAQI
ncbi:MAG: type II toxin-antitoxin system antitoxin SocA domain-containing protein, partial [Micropepsaceae bacterium]